LQGEGAPSLTSAMPIVENRPVDPEALLASDTPDYIAPAVTSPQAPAGAVRRKN